MWALEGVAAAEYYAIEPASVAAGEISATFHGRDVFAPAAAGIAAGAALTEMGTRIDDLVALPLRRPEITDGRITCEVVHIDRFGNAITSLDRATLTSAQSNVGYTVEAGHRVIGKLARTYADVVPGDAVALFGSSGHLEIAVREGDAARALGLSRGSRVVVRAADTAAGA
jgi:S-adenosylmethionine hydrolase